ncbi:hypothetical protein NQD34_016715 [Periophthalmus magnuspinnatus]|nr:hypothetical protein NQD34_016715 [Periophthalmus magnuspinnatus]
MKVPLLIALLITTVLCRPARKVTPSSSESSEEARRPTATLGGQVALVSLSQSASVQHVSVSSNSDESSDASEEQVAADVAVQVKSASVSDSVSAMASASTQSPESEDSDDDNDDDDDDTEESETEESESSESGEASTVSTATESPVIVTDDVTTATIVENITPDPIDPTIVTDDTADSGRGDSLGSYPSEYKSIVYVEDKSYHKVPEPHKSWDYTSKKSTYEPEYGNEVHKAFKVYKGVQVHQELLEGDTSTPEVESQDLSPRQASLDTEVSQSSSSDSVSDSTSDSSRTTEEDGQAKADSISSDSTSTHEESASTSDESPEGESLSQSSEEATPTPGAADSQSDESKESQSEEDAQQPEITTDLPMVVTAK